MGASWGDREGAVVDYKDVLSKAPYALPMKRLSVEIEMFGGSKAERDALTPERVAAVLREHPEFHVLSPDRRFRLRVRELQLRVEVYGFGPWCECAESESAGDPG